MRIKELFETIFYFDDVRQFNKETYRKEFSTAVVAARRLDSYKDLTDFIPESTTGKYKSKDEMFIFGPLPAREIGYSNARDYYWRTSPGEGVQKLNQAYATTSWTKKNKSSVDARDVMKPYEAALKDYDSSFKEFLRAAKYEISLRKKILDGEDEDES